jgi:ankyrin repeat protein
MNLTKSLPLIFVGLLFICACGKDPDQGTNKESNSALRDKSSAQISLESWQGITKALNKNNLTTLRGVFKSDPSIDPNLLLDSGETILTTAIKKDYHAIRDFILEKGASPERTNTNKETPMIVAAANIRQDSVNVLLDRNVDLNKKDSTGSTALHRALELLADPKVTIAKRKAIEDVAVLLVKAGASIEVTNGEGQNAYRLALLNHSTILTDIIRRILDKEYATPTVEKFKYLLKTGDVEKMNFMLTVLGTLPPEYDAVNPLVAAQDFPDDLIGLQMEQLLLTYKASINGPDKAVMTPLIKAVVINSKAFVQLFLEAEVDVNMKDSENKSALYHAVETANSDLVKILVHASAEKKYYVREAKFSFDGCNLARQKLPNASDEIRAQLEEIRLALSCGGRAWWSTLKLKERN